MTYLRLLRLWRWRSAGLWPAAHIEAGQALAHGQEAGAEQGVGHPREPGRDPGRVLVGCAVERRRGWGWRRRLSVVSSWVVVHWAGGTRHL